MIETNPSPASQTTATAPELPSTALAALFGDLVDALIPGNQNWPSASSVGVHGLLLSRLVEEWGEEEPRLVANALLAAGGPLAGHDAAARKQIVERFETTQPDLFAQLRAAVVLAYYESPVVAEAIRGLGRPYLLRPHLMGYPSRPFDTKRDTPAHQRGSYVATDQVKPVDLSGIDLATTRTASWGIKR